MCNLESFLENSHFQYKDAKTQCLPCPFPYKLYQHTSTYTHGYSWLLMEFKTAVVVWWWCGGVGVVVVDHHW